MKTEPLPVIPSLEKSGPLKRATTVIRKSNARQTLIVYETLQGETPDLFVMRETGVLLAFMEKQPFEGNG